MELSPLLDRLAGGVSLKDGRNLVRQANPVGLGQALFDRIAALVGSDPQQAATLAEHWRAVSVYATDPEYAVRAHAVGARIRGQWMASAHAFQRAGRLAADPLDRLVFAVGAIDSLARAGRPAEAVRLGRRLARQLGALDRPDLAARAELNVGNALLWQDQYSAAARVLARAARHLTAPVERAAAELGLSTAHLMTGQPDRVRRHAEAALATFDDLALPSYANRCNVNLAHEALSRGRADEALDRLLTLLRSEVGDAFDHAQTLELLGDVYLELNLCEEAADSYRSALERGRSMPSLNQAHCALGLARTALALEGAGPALRAFRTALRRYRQIGNPVWTAVAQLWLAEALVSNRQLAAARALATEARATLERSGSRSWVARSQIVLAEAAAAPATADFHAGEALQTLGRTGSPGLVWRARATRARSRPERRLHQFRLMFEAMIDGRTRTTSTASRAAYLQDKGHALREYLETLLATPTRARVKEALDVVTRSRGAALLDEILSSDLDQVIDPALLEELRGELHRDSSDGPEVSGARRASAHAHRASVQRRWGEATRGVIPALSRGSAPSPETAVYAELPEELVLIRHSNVVRLPISRSDLERELRWLHLDLLAPMIDPAAPAEPVLSRIRSLADQLGITETTISTVAPDASLWAAPWGALLRVDSNTEPVLLANPAMGGAIRSTRLPAQPRAALWIFEAPDLKHVEEEGRMFLEHFPEAVVCRTLSEVRRSFQEAPFDVLHVASHGRLCISNPMFSLLRFVDGDLYAGEIARSPLRVGLVTLSACETGRMSVVNRAEPDGLARAFLARGAQAVLGSAWPLEDAAALRTMRYYYQELANGETVCTALSRARDDCRMHFPHPYYWGAPVLLGGYQKDENL